MSKRNKIIIIVLALLLTCFIIIGISYAYWKLTYQATSVHKIVSSCFSMELANEKNNITLDDAYPISDEKGKSLTPYSFTITNTCDLFASYTINLEMLEGTTLDSKYVKTMINSEAITNLSNLETTETSMEGATESRILFKGSLGSGDSTDYTLRIWMDSDTPFSEDSMNKIFQSKITVTAEVSTYSPVENGFTLLNEALLVNEYQTTSLSVAKNKIASKQEVDFTKTAPIIEWEPSIDNKITTTSGHKTDPAYIGQYGITEKTSQILLGSFYEFDSETGFYTLKDLKYYDPNTTDFSVSDYYYCSSGLTITTNNTISSTNSERCSVMYKISSLKLVNDSEVTLSSGTIVNTKKYLFNAYKYSETELESDKSDKGLYEALDDYGTTYYYRGNVSNNIVKYANIYWKVIRINGDGSTRLLYYGTSANTLTNDIGIDAFNGVANNHTYVGYMYSNTLSSSYNETLNNDNDSNIKKTLDQWYKTNIVETGYSTYVADSGFCNDRSIAPDSPGDGYSTAANNTYYSPRYRVSQMSPTFICPNKDADLFTLSENEIGNKALNYPIGLVTVDELLYAGSVTGYLNRMTYAYSPETYWTMSPHYYRAANAYAYGLVLKTDGALANTSITSKRAIRPVINLNADTEISGGIGTKNDPFIIK